VTDWRRIHGYAAAALTSPVCDRVTVRVLGVPFALLERLPVPERVLPVLEDLEPRFDRSAALRLGDDAAMILRQVGALRDPPTGAEPDPRGEWDWARDLSRSERLRLRRHGWTSRDGLPVDAFAEALASMLGERLTCTADLERVMLRWLTMTRLASARATLRRGWSRLPAGYGYGSRRFEDLYSEALGDRSEPAPDGWDPSAPMVLEPADLEPLEDWVTDQYQRHLARYA
jgi:hypothetical protein